MAPTCTGMISTLRAAGSHAPDQPVSPFKLALAIMASFALLSAAALVAVGTDMEGWTWTSLKADKEAPEKEVSTGVVILSGDGKKEPICIDPDATKYKGKAIAAQCCEENILYKINTCYRKTDETSQSCIFGTIQRDGEPWPSFKSTTWAQASETCTTLGYTLCDQACSGKGCGYDNVWVWTKLGCTTGRGSGGCSEEWTSHEDQYSGGYANGENSEFDLTRAKEKCLELSGCEAVTCSASGSCTVRRSTFLKPSPTGEITYLPVCTK